ncbi:hypothetical protein IAU60_000651 [Kwoniella sp. DSM 27419]
MATGIKRKRDLTGQDDATAPVISRPKPGTKSFASGKSVKDALSTGSPQSFVSFRQQIVTSCSALPLGITHPTVVILQHYLETSPACEEIFRAWQIGDQTKNEQQAQAAVELLSEILNILTPLPFFRSSVIGLVNKIVDTAEPYRDYLNRLCQSNKRDDVYHGYLLSAAAMGVDPPTAESFGSQTSGRLGMKIWSTLVEGGSIRGLGKQMGMRRRNKEGMVAYNEKDPLDKPDIRHLILRLLLPLLSTSAFHAHARSLLPPLYSGLAADPPLTVYRVLVALWDAISGPSPGLNRRVSLVLFHEKSVEHLWQLLSRQDLEPTTGKSISEIVSAFLENITTIPGKGICFPDEGWYPRRVVDENAGDAVNGEALPLQGAGQDGNDNWRKGLHNRILGNVVRKIGNKVVDDDAMVGTWVTKVFEACPELIAGYWAHSALALDPRLNARWMATMAYVGRIISLPPPPLSTFRQPVPVGVDKSTAPFRLQPPAVSIMIESIIPSPLTKIHIMKGLQHTDGLVQHVTAITLARGLQKLATVQELFQQIEKEVGTEPSTSQENPWTRRKRELELEVRKRIPELSVIIAFAQKAATMGPAEEAETEAEIALAAKSAMLTEVALRIFGLCNKTLPSMASEMKFDPGRLLVSASSASAERRARREAREGSVVSDSGSVASVGTMGTAGMGGGFGQARGDVEGFEALSQLHVLQLLGEVRDWNWMNKAAGSQYTYLYHILLLQLSTQQKITQLKTVSLLQHLLLPTLLFEHDPSELSIWLDALPRASNTVSGPMLLAQQIHLLSFLDDCFRRVSKTPYRYIEDSFALVPDFFEYTRPTEMISPVIMAIIEQINAKIMGQLISTEAAGVVLVYMRRVILALVGKQKEMTFLSAVVGKFEEMLSKAKEAGQARVGLKDVVSDMARDLAVVVGKKAKKSSSANPIDPEAPHLRDQADWSARSFETVCMDADSVQWQDTAFVPDLVARFVACADDSTIIRRARFLLHLLNAKKGSLQEAAAENAALSLLSICFQAVRGEDYSTQLKSYVFGNDNIKAMYLGETGNGSRPALQELIARLDPGKSRDCEIADTFIIELVDALKADKKGQDAQRVLSLLQPWKRFMRPEPATRALKVIVKRSDKILAHASPEVLVTVSAIVIASKDPAYAVDHLNELMQLRTLPAVLDLAKQASIERQSAEILSKLSIKKDVVRGLLTKGVEEGPELIAVLSAASSAVAKTVMTVLSKDPSRLLDPLIIPTVDVLSDLPSESPLDIMAIAIASLTKASKQSPGVEIAAIKLVIRTVTENAAGVNEAAKRLTLADFGSATARLLEALVRENDTAVLPAIKHLLDLGLQYGVRLASNVGEISEADQDVLSRLHHAIELSKELELPVNLVEPVIAAIVEDRLHVDAAVELATLLTKRTEIKASFIRQQLQALFASSAYVRSTNSACPPTFRLNFTRLLHALFSASTYVSCQPNFIEPLLMPYRGTMAEADRLILHMFQLFEGYRKISVGSVIKFWSASGVVGNGNRSFDALTSLDPARVFNTCQSYPLRRPLRGPGLSEGNAEDGEAMYDPVFVMGLLISTMAEGTITGLDWVEILRSNAVGLTICGLSSRDADVRSLASYALAKVFHLVSRKPFFERAQTLYTLRLLRHAIPTATTRMPFFTTLFFAHTLRSIANPSHFLYPLTSRFLLQRPIFDVSDTPMLYSMLYASDEGWRRERSWMLRFLKDGLRSEADWRVVRRRKVWSLLATMFSSSLDPMFRRSVLQVMDSMVSIPAAARTLAIRDHLIVWLNMQWAHISVRHAESIVQGTKLQSWERDEKAAILAIVEKVCVALVPAEVERVSAGQEIGSWVEHVEMLFRQVLKQGVDVERLETLARITFRLSVIPGARPVAIITPLLLKHLESAGLEANNSSKEKITLYLFEIGLRLTPERISRSVELRRTVAEVGWRAERGDAGSDVADWVRREKRLLMWETAA